MPREAAWAADLQGGRGGGEGESMPQHWDHELNGICHSGCAAGRGRHYALACTIKTRVLLAGQKVTSLGQASC